MTAAAAKKETSFLLQNGATKPTLGRYEILQELGQGAMGIVYLGKDPSINREVAVKTINYADIAPDELSEVKARFFREAEAAGKLSHPNIVTIYDMGEDHDMAYIAMELLKGKELTHYCQKGKITAVKARPQDGRCSRPGPGICPQPASCAPRHQTGQYSPFG